MGHIEQLVPFPHVEQAPQVAQGLLPAHVLPAQLEKPVPAPFTVVAGSTAAAGLPAPSAFAPPQSLLGRLYLALFAFLIYSIFLGSFLGVCAALHSTQVVVCGLLVLFPASRSLGPFAPALAHLFPTASPYASTPPPANFLTLAWELARAAFVGGFAIGALCAALVVLAGVAAIIVRKGIPTNWGSAIDTVTSSFASWARMCCGPRTKRIGMAAGIALAWVLLCVLLPVLALLTGSELLSATRWYFYDGGPLMDEHKWLRAAAVVIVGIIVNTIMTCIWGRIIEANKDRKDGEHVVSLEDSLHGFDAEDASSKV